MQENKKTFLMRKGNTRQNVRRDDLSQCGLALRAFPTYLFLRSDESSFSLRVDQSFAWPQVVCNKCVVRSCEAQSSLS